MGPDHGDVTHDTGFGVTPPGRPPGMMVAVATHGARAAGLTAAQFPPVQGTVWRVFAQDVPPADLGALSALGRGRPDLAVIALSGAGVAHSRNAALAQAVAEGVPVLLFGDDDIGFATDDWPSLRALFAADPGLDFVCARLANPDGRAHKRYSPDRARARVWTCGKVGTPELAVRPDRFVAAGLRFDPGFGAGGPVPVGDEFIFLADALRAGLRGVHSDLVLGVHPDHSSGLDRSPQAGVWRRAVFRRALGPVAGLLAWGAWRVREGLRGLTRGGAARG